MRVVRTNYVGAVSVGVLLGQRLAAQGGGQLVALSSMAGERVHLTPILSDEDRAVIDACFDADSVEGIFARLDARATATREAFTLT